MFLKVLFAWGPVFTTNGVNFKDVDGVETETKNWVSEGTAVESEEGWF